MLQELDLLATHAADQRFVDAEDVTVLTGEIGEDRDAAISRKCAETQDRLTTNLRLSGRELTLSIFDKPWVGLR